MPCTVTNKAIIIDISCTVANNLYKRCKKDVKYLIKRCNNLIKKYLTFFNKNVTMCIHSSANDGAYWCKIKEFCLFFWHPNEMMGLIGAGNNPMVGMTVAVAVAIEEASK